MSVQTMAAVWRGSQHSGSALLMMLAIADFSDDKGVAYPAVSTLAEKTRMRTRNANYLLRDLQASGELVIKLAAGPRGTNLYRIALERLQGVHSGAGVQASAGVHRVAGVQGVAGLQPSAAPPALQCSKPLHPSADEPSMNHQEPPKGQRAPSASPVRASRSKKVINDLPDNLLPDWMPIDAWHAFIEMRKGIKKPATTYAQQMLVKKLSAFREDGHDVRTLIETSVLKNWQDIFIPNPDRPPGARQNPMHANDVFSGSI